MFRAISVLTDVCFCCILLLLKRNFLELWFVVTTTQIWHQALHKRMVPAGRHAVIILVDAVVCVVLVFSTKAGCLAPTLSTASSCLLGCFRSQNCYNCGLKCPEKKTWVMGCHESSVNHALTLKVHDSLVTTHYSVYNHKLFFRN